MHNAIGVLYQEVIEEAFRNRNIRILSQVRSSGPLAAPLPFMLHLDLYGHREFIRGIVTSSFSGMLWAPEVRDCANGTDLLRRVQTLVFLPHTLLNCWRIPYALWKQVDIEKKESTAIPVRRKVDGFIEYPENTLKYRFLKNIDGNKKIE